MKRNRLSRDEAERRIAAQPLLAAKLRRADVVIDNSGTVAATQAQVRAHWADLPIPEPASAAGHERDQDS